MNCKHLSSCGTGFTASGFISPPNEGVLWIFIALKNPWPLAGFEPMNLGSNRKHADH
jgi:hypothetical protein